jgi:hypothetical protein
VTATTTNAGLLEFGARQRAGEIRMFAVAVLPGNTGYSVSYAPVQPAQQARTPQPAPSAIPAPEPAPAPAPAARRVCPECGGTVEGAECLCAGLSRLGRAFRNSLKLRQNKC